MLGQRPILTFIRRYNIISWVRINLKIFYAGEILKTLNTGSEPVLHMMGR